MLIFQNKGKLNFQFEGRNPKLDEESEFNLGKTKDGTVQISADGVVIVKGETKPSCKIGDVEYSSLESAVLAAVDGDKIEMLKNCQGAGIALWANEPKQIEIDFGGFTYDCIGPARGSAGTQTQAFHFEKGSKVVMRNGKVIISNGTEANVKMLIQNYADLRLIDMDLDCSAYDFVKYVCSNNFGSMTVEGNTNIKAAENCVAFDVWFGMDKTGGYDAGVSAELADNFTGVVEGKVEYGAQNKTRVPEWIERTSINIKAGTVNGKFAKSSAFDEKPNVHVASNAKCDDATWDEFKD